MTADGIRVMVVDDHDVVRQGICALLNRQAGWSIVAEAGSVTQAVRLALQAKPDVVIMDLRLPDGSGIEACRDIRSELSETRVVVLTAFADDDAVRSSVLAGASSYVLKQTRGRELVEAVELVARGDTILDLEVTTRVLHQIREMEIAESREAQLTEIERTILLLIAEGRTNREIGVALQLSEKMVKHSVSNILTKVAKHRRPGAAREAPSPQT